MKFILSIGPQTTKKEGFFHIDLEDDAVQNMLIAYNGESRWPDKISPYNLPPPPPKAEIIELTEEEKLAVSDEQQKSDYMKNTAIASFASIALLAFGFTSNTPEAISLLGTFCLAGLAGYQVVWGVAPALHSPVRDKASCHLIFHTQSLLNIFCVS
jgi:H+-translocating NAD(P) transhydrogenase